MAMREQMESGLFYSRKDAEKAVDLLHDIGYGNNEISVMMSDETRTREFAIEKGTKTAEGTTAGVIVGGTLGGIVAGLTTAIAGTVLTGGMALPLVAGPIAAILAGVGGGGIVGGIIGALVGMGIPEERAHEIEEGVRSGGVMIAVVPHRGDEDRVREILNAPTTYERQRSFETGELEPTDLDDTSVEEEIPPRRTVS